MSNLQRFTIGFWIMGTYDLLLGLAFALFYREIYHALEITQPNHPGYVFVPALFLACGGIGEFLIALNPLRNTNLVFVRLLMKVSFAGAVLYCYLRYGMPTLFLAISVLSLAGIVKTSLFLKFARSIQPTQGA